MDYVQDHFQLKLLATNQELKIYKLLTNDLKFPCIINTDSKSNQKLKEEPEQKQSVNIQAKIKVPEISTVCSGDPKSAENQAIQICLVQLGSKENYQENFRIEKNQDILCENLLNYRERNEDWLKYVDPYQGKQEQYQSQQEYQLINISHEKMRYAINNDFNLLQFGSFSQMG